MDALAAKFSGKVELHQGDNLRFDQALYAPKLEGVVGKVVPTNMNGKSPKFLQQDFLFGKPERPGVYYQQCTPPSMGENRRSWQAYHAPY